MSLRRRTGRFAAWLAAVTILLSGIPPAGAGMLHASADPLGDHADFCSAASPTPGNPSTPNPEPVHSGAKVCAHCVGCTADAGSTWAPESVISGSELQADSDARIVAVAPAAAIPADLLAAPPRGPPLLV